MTTPLNSSKGLILVVDDSRVNLQLANAILKEHQYECMLISNPQEVIPWLETNRPNLILLDIMMPGLDGLMLCQQLKQSIHTASIPIIFLSAKASTEDVIRGLKSGGADYVTKPFQSEELIARVDIHVRFNQQQKVLAGEKKKLEESLQKIAKISNAMVKICAWTKQVQVDGQWISVDEYLSKHLGLILTHGICEEAAQELNSETQKIRIQRQNTPPPINRL